MESNMYVYCITHKLTGKQYVGKSVKSSGISESYFGSGTYLKKAIIKHGIENFEKSILEDNIRNKDELSKREKFWIKKRNTKFPFGYNLTDGGEGCQGMLEETKEKIRQTNRLKTGEKSSRFGKKNSEEHNDAIRKSNIGRILSEETKLKISISRSGSIRDRESIDKQKETIKRNGGFTYTEDRNRRVKQNQPNALNVSQYTKHHEHVADYPSAIEACRQTGINNTSIANCCKGRSKSAGGFIWKFTKEK
jgi:group I intron endonuclease